MPGHVSGHVSETQVCTLSICHCTSWQIFSAAPAPVSQTLPILGVNMEYYHSCISAFPVLTSLYHINIAGCQQVKQGHPLLCAPAGKAFRAEVLTEGPGCCLFPCFRSPSLRQALHLLSRVGSSVASKLTGILKRADGESPREEQGDTPSQSQSSVSLQMLPPLQIDDSVVFWDHSLKPDLF